ncbi:SWIM zinc finger family protein [uncultured Thiodictyon sp.]|uniref:SWIM zinc finger family protein n=1 Tax=uncultured Thiodictyon sp. TaxID=1846217 RepID=UPI0025D073D7|nr:SWIM zinc finger family protein [uncultured Thiodictyon sp.]
MPLNLSVDELLALAPDAASVKAAKGLVIPAKWPRLECDASAIWGECQGSGSTPYQAQIDLAGPAFRCTCPSRKFPCKHGLALGLLHLQHADRFTTAAPPGWVSEWLASRAQRAQRQEHKQTVERPAAPADPQAAARREAKRLQRMADGLAELEAWMADRLRQGLAQLPGQPEIWGAMAARMVDAQLPGLAERLRRLGELLVRGGQWQGPLLAELGRLQLLIDGARRLDALPAAEQADLRAALGLPQDKDDLLGAGERLTDDWLVLGCHIAEEDRLWMRRAWLRGQTSGRLAMLLDFSHGSARFEPGLVTGEVLAATLAFYPSAAPLRALFTDPPQRLPDGLPAPPAPIADELARLTDQIAANPWPVRRGLYLSGVPQPAAGADWVLRLGDDRALRLELGEDSAWPLVAVAGGAPVAVFGEWDGERLRPLSAWGPGLIWTAGNGWSNA